MSSRRSLSLKTVHSTPDIFDVHAVSLSLLVLDPRGMDYKNGKRWALWTLAFYEETILIGWLGVFGSSNKHALSVLAIR